MSEHFMAFEPKNHNPEFHIKDKMKEVFMAVCNAGEEGITTRKVADVCDMSVYSARNWLMKLEQNEAISKKTKTRNCTWHYG
jgi:FaeA-like protein.